MDFGDIGENIPVIAMVIGLILLQFFLRRRRPQEVTHQGIAQNLLAEVRLNHRIAEAYTLGGKTRKFMTTSWQRYKNKLDFLDQSLQVTLSDAFTMAEDFNQQIAAAKKYKSTSYMASVNVDKLKGPLTKSEEGLGQWLQSKGGTTEPPLTIPGMFDDLLGKS